MARKDYYNSDREKVVRAAMQLARTNLSDDIDRVGVDGKTVHWDESLNNLMQRGRIAVEDELTQNIRYFYLNPAQLTVYNFGARHTTVEAGRGTGKTDGLLAPFMIRCMQSMPGGSGIFLGNSIKQLFSRTVPALIKAFERYGFKEGIHFTRGHAPKKLNFREPYVRPLRWDNVLHFYNGFIWQLISTAVTGSANGMSVFTIVADESKFIPESKFNGEILQTLRGDSIKTDHPGFDDKINPFCKSTFLVSDAPLTPRQAWLYKRQKQDTEEVNTKIAEMLAELQVLPELVEAPKFVRTLQKLRCQSSAYFRFSTIENVDILGEDYINRLHKQLPPGVFDISIRNVENTVTKDGYYYALNIEEIHGYRNSDDSQMEAAARKYTKKFVTNTVSGGRSVRVETEGIDFFDAERSKNCIFDTDIIPGEPLRIAFDYNANVNAMVIGQTPTRANTATLKILNSMLVKNGRKLEALCTDFCKYYAPHQGSCNEVIFYYDSTAKQGGSYASEHAEDTKFYNIVKRVLNKYGWKVTQVEMGRPMAHNQKFEYLNGCLAGTQKPLIRINIENNERTLIQAMDLTMVKQTAKGFAKYKDTEKLKNLDNDELGEVASQSGITDITDAFDTLVIGVRFHNVSRLRFVGMPVGG